MRKNVLVTGLMAAVAASALVASPALADTAQAAAPVAKASPAPSCLWTKLNSSGYTDHLAVTSHCGGTTRYKVKIANIRDTQCSTIAPHVTQYWHWDYPGRFDGLEKC